MTRLRQYLIKASFASEADRHSALTLLGDMEQEVRRLSYRLAEERKWGHLECTPDNCKSSGTDCPKINDKGTQ